MLPIRTLLPILCIINGIICPPVDKQKPVNPGPDAAHNQTETLDLGIEYERYLREIISALESDNEFKQKLQTANIEDIKSGQIAHELQFVNHNVRSQLDELKRQELVRLRKLAREQHELTDRPGEVKAPEHLDHRNPHTFEIKDLQKLMVQTTKDLEEADHQRREQFREYELEKEHLRREELKKMDEEHRKKAEQEFEEKQKKHKDHPKVHHPGSHQQLQEVWEEQDHMPSQDWNPKTFFHMHDLDGNGLWDQEEVNALFNKELQKVYDPNNPEDDMNERFEEMQRMREHVYNETDLDRDGLISFNEFMDMTKRQDFNQDPDWEGLDQQEMYNEQELQEYERLRNQGIPIHDAANQVPVYVPHQAYPPVGYHPQQVPMYQGMPHDAYYQAVPPHQQGYAPVGGHIPQPHYQDQAGSHQPYQGVDPQFQHQGLASPHQSLDNKPHLQAPGQFGQQQFGQQHQQQFGQQHQQQFAQQHPNQQQFGQQHQQQFGQQHPNQQQFGQPQQLNHQQFGQHQQPNQQQFGQPQQQNQQRFGQPQQQNQQQFGLPQQQNQQQFGQQQPKQEQPVQQQQPNQPTPNSAQSAQVNQAVGSQQPQQAAQPQATHQQEQPAAAPVPPVAAGNVQHDSNQIPSQNEKKAATR